MKITTLKPHKGETWWLEFDDSGTPFFLHASVVHRFQLTQGQQLGADAWERVQQVELSRKAYRYACFLLDRRGYSYQEMYRKLAEKYPSEVCYGTVDRLVHVGLINDRAYAEQLAHHYVAVKHFGMRRARQEMRRRGLLDEQIDRALNPYAEQTDEMLMELIEGKYRKYFGDPSDRKMIEKGKAALVRQGYSFGEINAAVRSALDALEEEETEEEEA